MASRGVTHGTLTRLFSQKGKIPNVRDDITRQRLQDIAKACEEGLADAKQVDNPSVSLRRWENVMVISKVGITLATTWVYAPVGLIIQ
jgi:hypothetical protein